MKKPIHWTNQNFKNIKKIPSETTLSSITKAKKNSFNLKSIHAKQKKQTKTFTDRFSEQNKDLKIYANAKPKFKPKCLTSNVKKKLKKPQRQDQDEEAAAAAATKL